MSPYRGHLNLFGNQNPIPIRAYLMNDRYLGLRILRRRLLRGALTLAGLFAMAGLLHEHKTAMYIILALWMSVGLYCIYIIVNIYYFKCPNCGKSFCFNLYKKDMFTSVCMNCGSKQTPLTDIKE